MILLRPYQERALDELNAWFAEHATGHPIVHACVGAGKSIMLAEFCRRAVLGYPDYRSRILMLVPSKELAQQNFAKIAPFTKELYIGIVSASLGRKDTAFDKDVILATIGSVAKNPGALGRLDLILIDECHLVNRKETGQYRKLIADCQRYNAALRVVGWTGTPFRGDGVWLTEGVERLFTDIATRVTLRELLDDNYLAPLTGAETGIHIDASNVRMNGGDFVISELSKALDQDDLNERIARQIVELGNDRKKWLVYCVTVEHATHMAAHIEALGISVAVVSAKTPAAERDAILRDIKSGRLRCICNVAVLTTGVDIPDLDLIALVRNTRSPVLYTQIAGRGMRTSEGKTDCLWLDFTDTTMVMGPVDQIKGRSEPMPITNGGSAPFKICPECGAECPTALAQCRCGFDFPPPAPKINDYISAADPLSKVGFHTYHVSRVTYSEHASRKNPNNPPTLKVAYWSGMKVVAYEWICLEHDGYSGRKAERWWLERIKEGQALFNQAPNRINEALALTDRLKAPVQIVVREGGKWPELIRCIFAETESEAA